jgi:hypothetical protein
MMTLRTRLDRRTCLLGYAVFAVLTGWTSPAAAAASIGVMFPDNPPVNITAPPAPTPLSFDQSFVATGGTGHAIIHDGPGQIVLGGEVQAGAVVGATLFEQLEDVLHFANLPGPTPVTFHWLVDGTVLVPVHGISNLAVFNSAFISPVVTLNITADSCSGCFQVPVGTPTPVSLDISGTKVETNGVPQDIVLSMQLSAIDDTLLDFLHSAVLVIDLPPGVSVTSDGGFAATGTLPSVAEPSSLMILGSALVLAASLYRRKAR